MTFELAAFCSKYSNLKIGFCLIVQKYCYTVLSYERVARIGVISRNTNLNHHIVKNSYYM